MNKYKQMKTFMHVVEAGSIVKVANQLKLTKAAVSKQIIDLEHHYKVQLFKRTTRVMNLTDIGHSFYESLKTADFALAEAESVLIHANDQASGVLRIASHRYFGERFIIRNIKEFSSLHPNLKLDIVLADAFPDVVKENIDVLCGVGHEGPDHLIRKKIALVRYVLCASPEYIKKHGMPVTPEDLKAHRYITHSFRNPDNLLQFKNNKEVYVDYTIRLNDASAMLRCALDGLGFIKIFNHYVEDNIKEGKLIQILTKYQEPEQPLYLFYQHQKFIPIKIRLFIDFLCKKIEADDCFTY